MRKLPPEVREKRFARMQELGYRRRKLGMSRKTTAILMGFHESAITSYENGTMSASPRVSGLYEKAIKEYIDKVRRLAVEWGY